MKILVTGATGFIGRHVFREAARAGHEPLAWARGEADLDSGDAASILTRLEADAVIHLAWYARPSDYLESAENLASLAAALRFARAFQEAGGRTFVGVGTCLEYAASLDPLTEAARIQPESLYATCKAAGGTVLQHFGRQAGLHLAWARVFHLYGPGEDPSRLVPSAIRAAQRGEILPLSDPDKTIDLLHVTDVARALVAIAEARVEGPINVCSGVATNVSALAARIHTLVCGRSVGAPSFARVPTRVGDPSLLVRLTGFRPRTDLEQGLRDAVQEHSAR